MATIFENIQNELVFIANKFVIDPSIQVNIGSFGRFGASGENINGGPIRGLDVVASGENINVTMAEYYPRSGDPKVDAQILSLVMQAGYSFDYFEIVPISDLALMDRVCAFIAQNKSLKKFEIYAECSVDGSFVSLPIISKERNINTHLFGFFQCPDPFPTVDLTEQDEGEPEDKYDGPKGTTEYVRTFNDDLQDIEDEMVLLGEEEVSETESEEEEQNFGNNMYFLINEEY